LREEVVLAVPTTLIGLECVRDYPRPPALAPVTRRVRVELGGELLAESFHALRVLETNHPPTVYLPPQDVRSQWLLTAAGRGSWCEFKGRARYVDAVVGDHRVAGVGWFYPEPSLGYEALRDHIAFYPGRVDAAWLDDERISAQESDFYGGWITADLVGPFKGPPDTLGW
jgi:uncharacterized protein (DUF427 family)